MSLDLLTSVLTRTLVALQNFKGEEPDLGAISVSAIVLGGQGSSDDKIHKARSALLRTTSQQLLSCTAADGTPFGGLQYAGAHIVLPFSPPLSAVPPGASLVRVKKLGSPSKIGGASSDSFGSDWSTTQFAPEDHEKELGPLRTAISPAKQVKSVRVELLRWALDRRARYDLTMYSPMADS